VSARGGETLGGVYAQALAEAAEAKDALPAVGEDLATFAAAWAATADLRTFFLSGAVRRDAKHRAVEAVCRGKANDLFADFLHVLIERQRAWLLPDVAKAYAAILDARLGRVPVSLSTASALPPDAVLAIAGRLRAALGKDPVLTHHVRPGLVGGAVLRVGDVVADGSVRRRLVELRRRLTETGRLATASQES
jgi:F-type H+-transporting ATPase subunit delta